MKAIKYNESYKYYPESAGVIVIYCPGCKGRHYIHTKEPNSSSAMWGFNDDFEKPTFTPSIHIHYTNHETKQEITICHTFIADGKIQFLGDCRHELKGQTIDLPEIND